MATIREVIAGLIAGKSYIRPFGVGDFAGFETVEPIGEGMFEHTFAGHDYGGVCGLSINTLESDRWPEDGWSEWIKDS